MMIGDIKEWADGQITLIGGATWGEYDMADVIWEVREIKPVAALAAEPFPMKEPPSTERP